MVSLLTKLYFLLIGLSQLPFLYEITVLLHSTTSFPLIYINYSLGIIIIVTLICNLFMLLDGYTKYASVLLLVPVINVFIIPFISYKLTSSKLLTGITFSLWFSNLVFTLISNVPTTIYYGSGKYFLDKFMVLDFLSVASLIIIGYCVIYKEKKISKNR
ncbi:hypothetical protein [Saccharolobus solfataricus]|nr:hypothetical protein [Saccharolobus solfataricus]